MYDWTVDEFPDFGGYAVSGSVCHGCNQRACIHLASVKKIRTSREYYKPHANRQRRRVVKEMLRTGDRVKMPRMFTCWDII